MLKPLFTSWKSAKTLAIKYRKLLVVFALLVIGGVVVNSFDIKFTGITPIDPWGGQTHPYYGLSYHEFVSAGLMDAEPAGVRDETYVNFGFVPILLALIGLIIYKKRRYIHEPR